MARWICGVKHDNGVDTDTLYGKLGIQEVMASLKVRRLRLYGHVERATFCIKSRRWPFQVLEVEGDQGNSDLTVLRMTCTPVAWETQTHRTEDCEIRG
ncbi:hypothetical protein DPMN_100132 [Dreissena polymorpha]|uniref:Uncharacterized protein n=1 Tax=Dreissena polymorpha TaxID=45954 RepID=A0A9D4LGY0_DREPO|nr:hypothetical protein DPMN_100132 [Dreissena polymorpha]